MALPHPLPLDQPPSLWHPTKRPSSRTPGTPGTPSYPRTPHPTPGTPRRPSWFPVRREITPLYARLQNLLLLPNSRLINQPLPDLKNVKSKIGSTDNIKYQPKGPGKNHTNTRICCKSKIPVTYYVAILTLQAYTVVKEMEVL